MGAADLILECNTPAVGDDEVTSWLQMPDSLCSEGGSFMNRDLGAGGETKRISLLMILPRRQLHLAKR